MNRPAYVSDRTAAALARRGFVLASVSAAGAIYTWTPPAHTVAASGVVRKRLAVTPSGAVRTAR